MRLHCELDHSFPNYNPNPEAMAMLHDLSAAVREHGADVGLAFDGDGDRCGVVDNEGREIFADRVGVMLARDISSLHQNAKFVVDVKSTGLFLTDPVLMANGAKTDYWKTGHSYIKRYSHETGALVGFEKSGHFFFNPPIGRGYDDGLVSGLAVLDMLDRNPGKTLAELERDLPKTWQSPTMSPHCGDEVKYGVSDRVTAHFKAIAANGTPLAGTGHPRSRHRERHPHRAGGRDLGARARLIQQAGTGGGGRKPHLGGEYARHIRRDRRAFADLSGNRGL